MVSTSHDLLDLVPELIALILILVVSEESSPEHRLALPEELFQPVILLDERSHV